jgi:hypothetical protein
MILAADATRGWQFAGGTPRKQPAFHIFMTDIVPGVYLPTSLVDFAFLWNLH